MHHIYMTSSCRHACFPVLQAALLLNLARCSLRTQGWAAAAVRHACMRKLQVVQCIQGWAAAAVRARRAGAGRHQCMHTHSWRYVHMHA